MHKKPVKIHKRDREPAAALARIASGERRTKVNIEKDIGNVVGDWIIQRRENSRRERKDSENTIREWALDRGQANVSGVVDASFSLPEACGLLEVPGQQRLNG